MKFFVRLPIKCIDCDVEKAHFEGYVEAESAEEAISGADDDSLYVVVDKIEVYSCDFEWSKATAVPVGND